MNARGISSLKGSVGQHLSKRRGVATSTLHLSPSDTCFDRGAVIAENSAGMSVRATRYDSSVLGLEISNSKGVATLLPFQGQQVWDLTMLGRRLTMQSMYKEPRYTDPNKIWGYIDGYGQLILIDIRWTMMF
jgi:hypothetical protein